MRARSLLLLCLLPLALVGRMGHGKPQLSHDLGGILGKQLATRYFDLQIPLASALPDPPRPQRMQ